MKHKNIARATFAIVWATLTLLVAYEVYKVAESQINSLNFHFKTQGDILNENP